MPRQQYPSDEVRRKTRPHVKVHLTCRSHPRYGHVFEDPEQRGIAWGLWLLGIQYQAARTGGEVTLGHGDLTWLTGRSRWATALVALRQLCAAMDYPVSCEGRRVTVTIRNLQRKQGFDSADRGGTPRTPHPPEAEAEAEAEAERGEPATSSPPATDSPAGESVRRSTVQKPKRNTAQSQANPKRGTRCPEELTPEQWIQVRAWRDRKHPEFDDWLLESEWEKHALYWGAREKETRSNWAKSFKGWLLKSKELNQSKGGGANSTRPTPAVFKADSRPREDRTEAELAEIAEISAARHEKDRRARHAETATNSPQVEDEGGADTEEK